MSNQSLILLDQNRITRELFVSYLEAILSVELTPLKGEFSGIRHLHTHDDVGHIIINLNNVPYKEHGLKDYLIEKKSNIKVTIISTVDQKECETLWSDYEHVEIINSSNSPMLDLAAKLKSQNYTGPNTEQQDDIYKPIRIYSFMKFDVSATDIYLRLADNKYVKIINKNEPFDEDIAEKYRSKGVKFLFVTIKDFPDYTAKLNKDLNLFYESELYTEKQKYEIDIATLDSIHSSFRNMGADNQNMEESKNLVERILNSFSDNFDLWETISSRSEENEVYVEHTLATAYLTTSIARNMDITDTQVLESLSTACFFHDIEIEEPLTYIHDLNSVEYESLPDSDKKKILEHPTKSLRSAKDLLPDNKLVESIILQHHENVQGTGFPKGLSAVEIDKYAAIFILAEDFWHHLYRTEFSLEMRNKVIRLFQDKYSHGNFKSPLIGLTKIFDSN